MVLCPKRYYSSYFFGVLLFFILLLYFQFYKSLPDSNSQLSLNKHEKFEQILQLKEPLSGENTDGRISIIIREFENFENKLTETIRTIHAVLGNIPVFIIVDRILYPPVSLNPQDAVHIVLASDLIRNYSSPMHFFQTQYVFFLPDATTVKSWSQLQNIKEFLHADPETKAVAVPVEKTNLNYQGLRVDLKRWSISFFQNESEPAGVCFLARGPQGLLMEVKTFKSLAEPFARPFPFTFYVQACIKGWKVKVAKLEPLGVLAALYKNVHSSWKHKEAEAERLQSFYKTVGIKQETLTSGMKQFYGCNKETPRCFGTVVNDMPEYIYQGRWTPPCCLKALRETARHVLKVLDECQARYWLEGGTLLGAARHHDIIPWDYDVDVGIYTVDIDKCSSLAQARQGRFVDGQDFVWEKAIEGDFYRVQFSEVNHLHVDIFPFYSKNGTMTKDTWFPTHKQDTEFPESFLQPLTKIEFAGVMASAPNNIRNFLEYKFEVGVIEKPRYPNSQILSS